MWWPGSVSWQSCILHNRHYAKLAQVWFHVVAASCAALSVADGSSRRQGLPFRAKQKRAFRGGLGHLWKFRQRGSNR